MFEVISLKNYLIYSWYKQKLAWKSQIFADAKKQKKENIEFWDTVTIIVNMHSSTFITIYIYLIIKLQYTSDTYTKQFLNSNIP